MKFIIALIFAANSAWAVVDDEGDAPPIAKPYLSAYFQYETTLLLDRKTFTATQLHRLDLREAVFHSAEGSGVMAAHHVAKNREGQIINLVIEGRAEQMKRFFDLLLNQRLISQVYNMGGFVWSLPSQEYKNYWSNIYATIRRDIETKAIVMWASSQPTITASQVCSLMLEAHRVYAPYQKSVTLNKL